MNVDSTLLFDLVALMKGSQQVPYDRKGWNGRIDPAGPFLRFVAFDVAAPRTTLKLLNRSSDEAFLIEVTADRGLDLELSDVCAGDVLDLVAESPDLMQRETVLRGWEVPSVGVPNAELAALFSQDALDDVQQKQALVLLEDQPWSIHRELLEAFLMRSGRRQPQKEDASGHEGDECPLNAFLHKGFCGAWATWTQPRRRETD